MKYTVKATVRSIVTYDIEAVTIHRAGASALNLLTVPSLLEASSFPVEIVSVEVEGSSDEGQHTYSGSVQGCLMEVSRSIRSS